LLKNKKDNNNNKKREEPKSKKIYAWSDFIKSISKILWVIVIIIILILLSQLSLFKSSKKEIKPPEIVKKKVVNTVDWSKVNKEIEIVLKDARNKTEVIASKKLNLWIDKNMERVDKNFLNWYFSYWTQQEIGLKSLLYQVLHWVNKGNPTAAERITLQVQEQFSNRVLRPQIAQMEIERVINEIISIYSESIRTKLRGIPQEYKIKRSDWDRYISDIAVMVKNVEANRQTPVSLKALVGVSAGGAVIIFQSLKPIITKIGSKISAKLTTKTAAKMATKTGGKVAAKVGGKFAGAIIAIGIIIWDVWDHYQTKKKALPILRENIFDYFKEVKQSILHDPDYGIMTIIYEMEKSILENLKENNIS